MTKVYQISVRGTRAALDAPGSLKSKKVFLTNPTPEDINEFVDLATTRDGDYDLTWLKREGLKVAILELELADDDGMSELREFQRQVHQTALEHGWWDEIREDGTLIALMHAELSEALEALRKGNPPDDKCPEHPAVAVELADVIIRILDFAEHKGYDIDGALIAKAEFNKTRPRKHGKEF